MQTSRNQLPRFAFIFVLLALLIAGCGGSDDPPADDAAGNDPPPADSDDTDDEEPAGEPVASEALTFTVETVVDGLMIPWSIAFLPDGAMLVTERHGTLRIVRDGALDPVAIAGTPEVFAEGQGGLLDVAVHPEDADNGWIYLSYAEPGDGGAHTALLRARLDQDAHQLVEAQVLFSGIPKTNVTRHFGSRIVFRDGYVFVSMGDRGVMDEAQNLGSHNGSVIRLHDDGRVPADNPFVDEPGALPEIWSYGHRNVQGMTLHPETNEIWSHEHGPRGGDEINIVHAGRNYGWPEITYGIDYDGSTITDDTEREGMEQPVIHWTPSIAPSGMAFVNGDRYPEWRNNLMVGALVGQELRRVVLDGANVTHQETLLQGRGRIRDVKTGPDGYLYLANESTGEILRLVPAQ